MPSYRAFCQIKIRHIFIMQFGGYFVKFYSRQIFRPYGISLHTVEILAIDESCVIPNNEGLIENCCDPGLDKLDSVKLSTNLKFINSKIL